MKDLLLDTSRMSRQRTFFVRVGDSEKCPYQVCTSDNTVHTRVLSNHATLEAASAKVQRLVSRRERTGL